ncbi:penicillin acylase family protein, partial [Kutzneria sp. 744]|uniref:penicillin acylase family protein n=1 Tax=Kutzneria sp. (strain 744) TaxID=345341 RepID=UPI0003EEB8D4
TARIAPSADASAVGLPPSISDWLGATGGGEGPGSNAWAVAGSRTASGRPLLANDPHLVFTQPNVWYQIGLRLDDGERRSEGYGVTLPGIPGLVAGANDDLAFGITNATVDTQDLCLLDADQQLPDAWTEETTVKVRGGADVPVRASGSTGCVELEVAALGGRRCALFWSGYWPSSEIDGSLDTWRARSYPEFRDALRHFGVPVLNHIVAAADGTIALKTAGRVPAREPGSGLRPAGFDEVARSWRGFLEFDELPEVVDPDEGYLVSANNKLLPEDDPRHLGVDWAGAYRAPRIDELLDATDAVTDQDCARWQLDVANLRARRLLPHLLSAFDQSAFAQDRPADEPDAACLTLLRDWDHRDAPELAAPLIFAALLDELAEDWIVSRLGKELAAAMPDSPLQLDHLVVDARARVALGVPEQLRDSVPAAFTRAVARLVEKWGDDPRRWRNDTAHRIADSHLLGRAVPLLGSLFGGTRTPVGASLFSVRLMQPDATGAIAEGAPWRFVAEVGAGPTERWDVLRHGSSGHPLAPHYEDQTAAHAEGRLYRVSPGFPR